MNTLQIVMAVLELIAKYGFPAVKYVFETWAKDYNDLTADDLEKLKELIKHPDAYLDTTETASE